MKKITITIFCIGLFFACKEKENTPTISKEEQEIKLAEQQFAQIDLEEVDIYPNFEQCNDSIEDKRKCFETHLSELYSKALQKHTFPVSDALNDTITMFLKVDNTGKIVFEHTNCSEKTREMLPQLDSILATETETFEHLIPAQKQDVNVSTQFKLPLIINVK